MNKHLFFAGCAVAALAIAAGCGGGGTQATPPTQQSISGQSQSGQSAQGTVRLMIPAKSGSSSSARSPEYVSANTQSFTVQVGTGVPTVTTVPGTSCTSSGSGYTCTANFTGVVGANTLTIATYASTNGTGTPLSEATTTVTLTSGTNSPVNMTLNPVVATQVLVITSPSPPSVSENSGVQSIALSYSLEDSTGATVVASEGTLVDSNGNPLPTATPSVSASPSTGVTVGTYSGTSDSGTLTATVDTSQVTTSAKFTVAALAGTNIKSASATLTVSTATASPSASPSATPTNLIVNGNFSNGLTGWTACSFARTALSAPVSPSPAPKSTPAQTTSTSAISSPTSPPVSTPLPNVNPNVSPSPIPAAVGSDVVLTGDPAYETKGASGICQSVAIPAGVSASLTLWVYEAGGEYNFKYNDQEADVLDSTGTTVEQVLFTDLNCFQYPTSAGGIFATQDPSATSGCWPSAYGGDPYGYDDWQGGYWTERGPFDLSSYAGETVTLFFGVWDSGNETSPTYGNAMYVGNVQLQE